MSFSQNTRCILSFIYTLLCAAALVAAATASASSNTRNKTTFVSTPQPAEDSEPKLPADIVSSNEIFTCPASLSGKADLIAKNIEYYIAENQLFIAQELASDCADFGSSIDVGLISPVLEALDKNLNKHMKTYQKKDLADKLSLCSKRFAGANGQDNGSLGRSAAAHCELKIYGAFDSLYGKRVW